MGRLLRDGIVDSAMGVATERLPDPVHTPRCTYCGAVIGVYEPLVRVLDDDVLTTSRAAEPSLSSASPGLVYHAVCYELSRGRADT
jgi:hypothetical protein